MESPIFKNHIESTKDLHHAQELDHFVPCMLHQVEHEVVHHCIHVLPAEPLAIIIPLLVHMSPPTAPHN